ncbi:hypothetical protein NIES37_10260 [Tolypothrix tenuis PCC 7101]|uniref:Uncharacterized protein n=1 Tax=Tolypothrix tenuis PCC 7101 TaxID=231146 RepID=A0A1Z4MUD3_9CYAN|nr:hypothetical protein [Aulosira sp. FACHB-113]BAY97089.1 hypothetical protein NIES37_10260 [Tolypothrix tenuis PCC 7101]BAZ72403.1 hypothetical protein NIES50_09570 [Aulosira laxa NIES-50]
MKFLKIGHRLINLNAIATVEFSSEKVIIGLVTPTQENIEFYGQEAQDIKDYFYDSNLIYIIPPPPKPPLEVLS